MNSMLNSIALAACFSLTMLASECLGQSQIHYVLTGTGDKMVLRYDPAKPAPESLAVSLRYCVPGQVAPFNLDSNGFNADQAKPIAPFYIAEREITQGLFFAVLEKAGLAKEFKAWHDAKPDEAGARRTVRAEYLTTFVDDDVTGKGKGKPRYVGDNYPIYGLSIQEAAFFCRALEKLRERGGTANDGLLAFRFRLPTYDEWQYACRAAATVDEARGRPHFNLWPDLNRVDPGVRTEAEELWKKVSPKVDPFTGSQAQFVKMLEPNGVKFKEAGEEKQFNENVRNQLAKFLKFSMGLDYNFNEQEYKLLEINKSPTLPNNWGLFDMHGSVSEWTIEKRADWDRLPQGPDDLTLWPAGGNFFHTGQGEAWREFTVWGAPKKNYSQGVKHDDYKAAVAGIRLVVEVLPRPDAPAYIRRSLAAEKGAEPAEVNAKIDRVDNELKMLAANAPAEAQKLLPTVNYNKAMAYRAIGEFERAKQMLKEASAALKPDQKEFLDQISYQIGRDRKLLPK
jgi:formylglycine-generating enzyme required for sulfatase activity